MCGVRDAFLHESGGAVLLQQKEFVETNSETCMEVSYTDCAAHMTSLCVLGPSCFKHV